MTGVVARRLTISCSPPQSVYNHWVEAAAELVDVSGYGRSKVGRKRPDPLLAGLERVSGLMKGLITGQVIHKGSAFSTAFPKLSTAMGKDPAISTGEAGKIARVGLT
jgi:hypothetical protein